MNNKLIIGIIIVILFLFIFIKPLLNKKESFSTLRYPARVMTEHNNYINSKSNQYSNIFSLFKQISKNVYDRYKNAFDSDNTITINEPTILDYIRVEVLYRFNTLINNNSTNCDANFKNEECKLYIIILQYIKEKYPLHRPTHSVLVMDDTSESDIEKLNSFVNIKDDIENLFQELLQKYPSLDNFSNSRKKIILEKFISEIIFNIYFTIYPSASGELACSLYTSDTCPSLPEPDAGDGNAPTFPTNLVDNYKCKLDKTVPDGMSKLCINKDNNKVITTECQIMNGYGEEMCENTLFKDQLNNTSACQFENVSQKCKNRRVPQLHGNLSSNGEYVQNNGFPQTKCHLVYHNDLDKMQHICERMNCLYNTITDENQKEYGVCMARQSRHRPANFCLELSNIDREFAQEQGCSLINRGGGNQASFFYSVDGDNENHSESELKCHLFDTVDQKINPVNLTTVDKLDTSDNRDFAYVKGNENQQILCEGLRNELGENKCKYVEYLKNIPNNHNSKFARVGMCVPRNLNTLPADLLRSREQCSEQQSLYWSAPSSHCVNTQGKCHDFKHKGVCNLYDNCLWQATDIETASRESEYYESGYCKDISNSLDRVEDLIDNIHNNYIEQTIDIRRLEDSVSKLVPKFKNVLSQ